MKIDWSKEQAKLEEKGAFNHYLTPYNYDHTIPVDENYEYLPKSALFGFSSFFYRSLLFLFGAFATKIIFNAKYYGKKKLKEIRKQGFFTIMNHCSFLDNLMLRHAIRDTKKVYLTVAQYNCKSGFAGHVLRAGGILPIADTPSAMRNMNKAFHTLIKKKNVIHFYPEEAMWLHYPKPRPFKKGVFSYAIKEDVPVVPVYIAWTKSKGLRKLLGFKDDATVFVLDPIYPQQKLSLKENMTYMQQNAQKQYADKYREFYGIQKDKKPCIYDVRPEYIEIMDEESKYAVTL